MAWLGAGEIIVILILTLILFGPKKLPELGRFLGSGLRELRKYSNAAMDVVNEKEEEKEKTTEIPERLTESPDIVSGDFDETNYPGNIEIDLSESGNDEKTQKAQTDINDDENRNKS